jgi:hypothetical protein
MLKKKFGGKKINLAKKFFNLAKTKKFDRKSELWQYEVLSKYICVKLHTFLFYRCSTKDTDQID